MTTRVFQGSGAALTTGTSNPRVFQGGAAALVTFVNVNSSPRVFGASAAILVRNFPVRKVLEVFPSRDTFQTSQPKKRVDLL